MLTTCYYKRKELKKEAEKKMEKRTGENRQDSRRAVCQGERGINWRTAPPFLCRESPFTNGRLPEHNGARGIDKCTSYQFPLTVPFRNWNIA